VLADTTQPYLRSQIIPYIGNKRRLLGFLDRVFEEIEGRRPVRVFADPFAGSGAVSRLARVRGWRVLANDWEPFCLEINRCHLGLDAAVLPRLFGGGLERTLEALNALPPPPAAQRYVARHYAPRETVSADYRRERLFYTTENALRIDAVRACIDEMAPAGDPARAAERSVLLAGLLHGAAVHANTSGVFKAFHKGFGGHGREALSRILAPIRLQPPALIDGREPGAVFAEDAAAFAGAHPADLYYLDPPYNQHQYGSNYHLLNTIALWDRPPVDDSLGPDGRLRAKAAIRGDWMRTRSDYCSRSRAATALRGLLDAVDARWIVLSYSSDGIIPLDELREILGAQGRVQVRTSSYVKYRGGRQSAGREIANTELVWVVERGRPQARGSRAAVDAALARERLSLLLAAAFAPARAAALLAGREAGCEPVAGVRLAMPHLHRFADPAAAVARLAALPPAALADLERRLAAARCSDRVEELSVLAGLLPLAASDAEARAEGRRALQLLRKLAHRKTAGLFASGAAALRGVAAADARFAFVASGVGDLEAVLAARVAG
jgi:adenine-specific DNA-methyltransferase